MYVESQSVVILTDIFIYGYLAVSFFIFLRLLKNDPNLNPKELTKEELEYLKEQRKKEGPLHRLARFSIILIIFSYFFYPLIQFLLYGHSIWG